jgi:predicted metalloprotease with PDZ domain
LRRRYTRADGKHWSLAPRRGRPISVTVETTRHYVEEFAMRSVCGFAAFLMLAIGANARADDEGSIGVQIKLDDGKVVVVEPIKGSPADKAGIKADDVILKVNDYKVKEKAEPEDLQDAVKEVVKHKPGEKIKLTIKRGDKEMVVEVTVGKRSEIFPKEKE